MSTPEIAQMSAMLIPFEPMRSRRARGQGALAGQRDGR